MRLRERLNDAEPMAAAPPSASAGAGLGELRERGQGHLAAGADAIERALSGDSEKFLEATRQAGGQ